jgi:hypothetical protein
MAYDQMRSADQRYGRAAAPPLYDSGRGGYEGGYQQGAMSVPQMQQMTDDPTAGLGFLSGIDGLFIQERVEFFEGDCAERVCCPLFRSFEMDFKDGTGATFFTARRPYRCTVHTPCFLCQPQELDLIDAHGVVAARAREEFRPCWLCARSFVAENERGEANYRVRTSECGTSQGNNCCAPSCFNQSYVVDVFDPEEAHVVARSANVWPGCNCAGATERSNIVLRFPKNATDRERASLVAATVLVEFAHFEWKKGDNQEGGPVGMLL